MLLQRLYEYADRAPEIAPAGYSDTRIHWFIDLDQDGKFQGFVPLATEGPKPKQGKRMSVPHVLVSSGVRAKLLIGNGEYVLGVARGKGKQERVNERHRKFKELVSLCAQETNEPSLRAVSRFLEALDPESLPLPQDFDPSQVITFRVNGRILVDLPSVRSFWQRYIALKGDAPRLQCVICGKVKPVERRLPMKIKRIPGGQTSGVALISANAEAFESYGLKESLIAPTCNTCAERFTKAVQALIDGEQTHLTVGPVVYLFWTRGEGEWSPARFLSEPEPGEVQALIESAEKGKRLPSVHAPDFYAACLSASGGRAVVRDWLETTIPYVQQNLARWFRMQRLVNERGAEGSPLGVWRLAVCLYRDTRDIAPTVAPAILRVALHGGPLPDTLLSQAVRRNRAEGAVPYARAVLMKMVLVSSNESLLEEGKMEQLDKGNREPAYLCGRLLAVLESVQYAAIPCAKATIIDRFFGAASTAPASVFGTLLRGAQSHLGKLRKEKPGAYHAIEMRLQEVLEGLESFPKTLTLRQQALFALGYYHQRAADARARTEKSQKKEEKED